MYPKQDTLREVHGQTYHNESSGGKNLKSNQRKQHTARRGTLELIAVNSNDYRFLMKQHGGQKITKQFF